MVVGSVRVSLPGALPLAAVGRVGSTKVERRVGDREGAVGLVERGARMAAVAAADQQQGEKQEQQPSAA